MPSRPLLFACQGCAEFGDTAHEVASVLDARGFAEAVRIGTPARGAVPVYAIEGCGKRCAGQWLRRQGIKAQRQFILAAPGDSAEQIAERIMEGWSSRLA